MQMIDLCAAQLQAGKDREEVIRAALGSEISGLNAHSSLAVINGYWLVQLNHRVIKTLDDYQCRKEFEARFIALAGQSGWCVTFDDLQHCFRFSPRKEPCG